MKISLRRGYIEVESDGFLYWYSMLTGTKGRAKMAAFFPFIFTIRKIHPTMKEYFINHERIHFAQQCEKLIIGHLVFSFFETLYYRVIRRKSGWDAYVLKAGEQEAYDNMRDLGYLARRKWCADVRTYMAYKPVTWSSLSQKNLETEGFPHVYEWTDAPFAVYPPHSHSGKVCLLILVGGITFTFEDTKETKMFGVGDRVDILPGAMHSARIGPLGCTYVVGQEHEEEN